MPKKKCKKSFDVFLNATLSKSLEGEGEVKKAAYSVRGIGSTLSQDRQGDKLSDVALKRLEEISNNKKIPVFSDHNHTWENTMGFIKSSSIKEGKWDVDIALESPEANERCANLINKMEHGTPIGLSIGGRVLETHTEKSDGSFVRIIDDLELLELSFVGIPANKEGSVISYIAKSLEGEEDMTEEVKVEAKAVEAPIVEKAVEVKEVKQEPAVDFKKEFEELKKSLVDQIAVEISKMQAVKKSVVEETSEKKLEKSDAEKSDEALEKALLGRM